MRALLGTLLAVAVCILGMQVSLHFRSWDVLKAVEAVAEPMSTISTRFTDAEGNIHIVETPRRPEEERRSWLLRHRAAVDEAKDVSG